MNKTHGLGRPSKIRLENQKEVTLKQGTGTLGESRYRNWEGSRVEVGSWSAGEESIPKLVSGVVAEENEKDLGNSVGR